MAPSNGTICFRSKKRRTQPPLMQKAKKWRKHIVENVKGDYMNVVRRHVPAEKLPVNDYDIGANAALELLAFHKDPPLPVCAAAMIAPPPAMVAPPAVIEEQKIHDECDEESTRYEDDMKAYITRAVNRVPLRLTLKNDIAEHVEKLNDAFLAALPKHTGEVRTKFVDVGKTLYRVFFQSLLLKSSGSFLYQTNKSRQLFGITTPDGLKKLVDPSSWEAEFVGGPEGKTSCVVRARISERHPVYVEVVRSTKHKIRFHFYVKVHRVVNGVAVPDLNVFG